MVDFKLEADVIVVNEQTEDEVNYEELFGRINSEIEEMNKELENLLFLKA